MHAQLEKLKENKNKAVANSVGQKKSDGKQNFGFADNRPEAVAQRKNQNMVAHSAQIERGVPVQRIIHQKIPNSFLKHSVNKDAVVQLSRVAVHGKIVDGSEEEILGNTLMEIMFNCAFKGGDHQMSMNAYQHYLEAFQSIENPTAYDSQVIHYLEQQIADCRFQIEGKIESEKAPIPYSNVTEKYHSWTPEMAQHEFPTPYGPVNARHNRKAPYITTNKQQYPETSVRVDYSDIIAALKKENVSDKEIAEILLEANVNGLTNPNSIRAAAMLVAIVYLAEEWRKQGATKVFRSILRLIMSSQMSLSDIPRVFEFVTSAHNGREQVSRIHQVLLGKLPIQSLDSDDQEILGAMSPIRQDDLDSDEDMRSKKEADLKSGRSWGIHGSEAKKEKIDHSNIFKINGKFYNIADPRIRNDGQCLWDTLQLFGVQVVHLQNAALNIQGVTYGDYVAVDQLNDIVTYLNDIGYSLMLNINTFGYQGNLISNHIIGNGATIYQLGLVVDSHGMGHFIPSLN